MASLNGHHSPRHNPSQEHSHHNHHHQHEGQSNSSTSSFLQKLPASTIRNGRVVDVRQSVTNLIAVCSTCAHMLVSLTKLFQGPPLPTSNQLTSPRSAEVQGPATNIKVRLETGDFIVVRLRHEDTIQHLRAQVDKYR